MRTVEKEESEVGQEADTCLNVRRFLFGIHFSKGAILTGANAADSSRLTPSSSIFFSKQRREKQEGRA